MYKVFIDNSFIVFKKNEKFSTKVGHNFLPHLSPKELSDFKTYLKNNPTEEPFVIAGKDPLRELKTFFSEFNWIEAAGGIVKREGHDAFLFIERNGIWDIPKGKIEKGESPEEAANREVMEECGLTKLTLQERLPDTYHVYYAYEKYWIKKTYWYQMTTDQVEVKPQREEGITKVKWFTKQEAANIKNKTYKSLQEIIDVSILT